MLTFRQGHTYTFNVESIWVDENGTAVVILPGGDLAFAPVAGTADQVARQAVSDVGLQVSTFQPRAPDVSGQRLYAAVATWHRPDGSVPDTYPCTISGSTSRYHSVQSWPSGIGLSNVAEYDAGVPRPQYTQHGGGPVMQNPQAGEPTPGPGYRGSYLPPLWRGQVNFPWIKP